MKSEDVREILSQINSLDRDEWAAAWSRMGERYQTRAAEQERTDPKAASESYLVAFCYFAFGGWPAQNSVGKKGRLREQRRGISQARTVVRSADRIRALPA